MAVTRREQLISEVLSISSGTACCTFPAHWLGAAGIGKDGKPGMQIMSLKAFHASSDTAMMETGYEEHEIARRVEQFGAIYYVWSTYETRYEAGGRS